MRNVHDEIAQRLIDALKEPTTNKWIAFSPEVGRPLIETIELKVDRGSYAITTSLKVKGLNLSMWWLSNSYLSRWALCVNGEYIDGDKVQELASMIAAEKKRRSDLLDQQEHLAKTNRLFSILNILKGS